MTRTSKTVFSNLRLRWRRRNRFFWDLRASNWTQFLFGLSQVALTIGLLYFAFLQYHVYVRQALIMANQTNISDNQLKEMKLEDRAWIAPSAAGVRSRPSIFTVLYRNTGKEPATNVMYSVKPIGIFDLPIGLNLPALHAISRYLANCWAFQKGVVRINVVRIGTVYPSSTNNYELDGPAPAVPASKAKASVIAGCFFYETESKVHASTFCFFSGPESHGPLTNWSFCPIGNDAS